MTELSSGNLKKDYRRFAVPTMLCLFVYAAYSMVDGMFVGQFVGQTALAAVNFGAPFLSLLFALAILMAVGGSTISTRCLGQGKQREAGEVFSQSVVYAAVIGLVIGIVCRCFLTETCRLLGASEDVLAYTMDYVGTLAFFAPAVLLEYNLEVLVRADGAPRFAALAECAACGINIVLDWVFVRVLGLGVWGAAFATGLAQALACAAFFAHFLFSKHRMLRFVRFRISFRLLGQFVFLGIPEALTDLCVGIVIWLYNHTVLRWLGTEAVAAYTVVAYVSNLVLYTLSGASQSLQPLVSFHRGEGDSAAVGTLRRYALWTAFAVGAVFVLLLELMPGAVAAIFLPAEAAEIRALAVYALRRYSLCFLLAGFSLVTAGYTTACEKPLYALGITLGRGCILPAAALTVLTALFGAGGIWWAALLSETVMLLVSALILRKTRI